VNQVAKMPKRFYPEVALRQWVDSLQFMRWQTPIRLQIPLVWLSKSGDLGKKLG
jgi:hypothetical protein